MAKVIKNERTESGLPLYQELDDGNWLRYEYDEDKRLVYAEDSKHGVMLDIREKETQHTSSGVDFSRKITDSKKPEDKTAVKAVEKTNENAKSSASVETNKTVKTNRNRVTRYYNSVEGGVSNPDYDFDEWEDEFEDDDSPDFP